VSGGLTSRPGGYTGGVNEHPSDESVAAIVGAIDERTATQTSFIMAALVRGVWPGGVADRREPGALEWVRRWGPNGPAPEWLGDCSCVHGSCLVCN
jgi:hypothetical protein